MTRAGVYEPMSEHARLWAARVQPRGVVGASLEHLARQPTSAMSERELERGLGSGRPIEPRSEPCACGGVILVEDGDDDWLVARAVRVHNESTPHQLGLRTRGWGA